MKTKLTAGAEVEFLTKQELSEVLTHHFKHISEIRFRKIPYSGKLPVRIGAPESGYMWSVRLLSTVLDFDDRVRVYAGEHEDSALVGLDNAVTTEHVLTWNSNQCVAFGTQHLIVRGGGAAHRAQGLAIVEEVPLGREWRM